MKTNIELKQKKRDTGKTPTFPKKITLEAETPDEAEVLQFMVDLNEAEGLIPTMDKLIDMINNGQLERQGDKWQLKVGAVLKGEIPDPMFG